MAYYIVEPPRSARIAWRAVLVVLAAILFAAAGVSYAVSRPLSVTVDGLEVEIPAGSTVGDLSRRELFKAPPGDLLSVSGSVVTTAGGESPAILRNGSVADTLERVYRGDVFVSRPGADVRESVVVTEVPIPFVTRVDGTGPVVELKQEGQPGLRRVSRGEVSGVEVSSTVLVPPREEVLQRVSPKPGSKLVALTFDDGPWPDSTMKIVETLDRYDVKATFFMLGRQVKKYPATVRRIEAGGHLLASHSYSHKYFSKVSAAKVRSEIAKGRNIIKKTTGVYTPWIRPPYGAMNAQAWREARKMKARVVMWDVDPQDWKKPGAKKIADRVVKNVKPGSVVLLHDGGGDRTQTIKALPSIIARLKAKGYVFVTIEELVDADGVSKGSTAKKLASNRTGN